MVIVVLSASRPGRRKLLFLLLTIAGQIQLRSHGGRLDYTSLENPGQTHRGRQPDTFFTVPGTQPGDQKSISAKQSPS
ncbi:MAG: hypothetical protein PSV24_10785, partial [Rhodoferax sp.]|nr:hypothetical protein [Rhodoferax sp.]